MARFRADRCLADAAGLVSCEDMSGHGFTATAPSAALSPNIEPARIGSQPALVSLRQESLRFGGPAVSVGTTYTMAVVGQYLGQYGNHLAMLQGDAPAGTTALKTAAGGTVRVNYAPFGGAGTIDMGGNGWNGTTMAPLTSGQPFVAVVVGTGQGVSLYVNNIMMAFNPAPTWHVALNGSLADGQLVPAGQPALTVAEAIVYNRALSKAELDGVHAYARQRYGLSYPSNVNLAGNSTFDTTPSDYCYVDLPQSVRS